MEPTLCTRFDRLIDNVENCPLEVIEKVFEDVDVEYLRKSLFLWLIVALSNNAREFYKADGKLRLITFHDNLHLLVEALFSINLARKHKHDILYPLRKELKKYKRAIDYDPFYIIKSFCKLYTVESSRSELREWFFAGVLYEEELIRDFNEFFRDFDRINITMIYEWVLFLLEAAYVLNTSAESIYDFL